MKGWAIVKEYATRTGLGSSPSGWEGMPKAGEGFSFFGFGSTNTPRRRRWGRTPCQNYFAMDVWGIWRLNFVMALYLVVRHRLDKRRPPFENVWFDNELLKEIKTTSEIGELCKDAKKLNHFVHIHRCGCRNPYSKPMICCSAQIADVTVNSRETKVLFHNQKIVNVRPLIRPIRGQSFYPALAP